MGRHRHQQMFSHRLSLMCPQSSEEAHRLHPHISLCNCWRIVIVDKGSLPLHIFCDTIPSLTVKKRKNHYTPYIYWSIAVFYFATDFGNLFPPFTFLNGFHLTFCYELIICSKAAGIMKGIRNHFPFVCMLG